MALLNCDMIVELLAGYENSQLHLVNNLVHILIVILSHHRSLILDQICFIFIFTIIHHRSVC